jgi:hypothetical protein
VSGSKKGTRAYRQIDLVRSKQNSELNELVWRLAASGIFYLENLQQEATLIEGISEHQL